MSRTSLPGSAPSSPRLALDFSGRSVLITGVGHPGQVGETVAQTFGQHGANVLIVDRDRELVEARAEELNTAGANARGYAADLSQPDDVAQLAGAVESATPAGLDALVNLAGGFAMSGLVSESDPNVWHRQISINLTTSFLTTRALLPSLRKARGSIVFFAAAAALPGANGARMSAYVAAKSGVLTLMRAIAAEERDSGVRANALAPTTIRTETNIAAMGESMRYVERETIADWVMWLASPLSGPVTGQALRIGI